MSRNDYEWRAENRFLEDHAPAQLDTKRPEPVACEVNGFIARVPDHCDRVVWRDQYIHLDHRATIAALTAEIARLQKTLDDHLESEAAETMRADKAEQRIRELEAEVRRRGGGTSRACPSEERQNCDCPMSMYGRCSNE